MDQFELRDGAIWCEKVPLSSIAEAVGTPVYVYSTAAMVSQASLLVATVADCGNGDTEPEHGIDKARLRTIVTAAHADEQLDRALAAFDQVGHELGLIAG